MTQQPDVAAQPPCSRPWDESRDKLVINDLFRAVHDYFGHAKEGYEFGPRGEYNAYLAHSRMFSDEARPALTAETMGQNSWVNFGQHLRDEAGNIPKKGEKGYVAPQDRPFAAQKSTVLPDELTKEALAPAETENGQAPAKSPDKSSEPIHYPMEMAPGKMSGKLPGLQAAPYGTKLLYQRQMLKAMKPLFDEFQVKPGTTTKSSYKNSAGETEHNPMTSVELPADKAKLFALLHGHFTDQESVAGGYSETKPGTWEPTHPNNFSETPDYVAKLNAIPAGKELLAKLEPEIGPAVAAVNEKWEKKLKAETNAASPQFKAWFKDSKLVDDKGKPQVFYRGTAHPQSIYEGGGFFTDSKSDAQSYADLAAISKHVGSNDELSEMISDMQAEEGGESLTDFGGADRIREIAEANGITLPSEKGHTEPTYLRSEKPLDLRDLGSGINNLARVWQKLHASGLLPEKWTDLDSEVRHDLRDTYNGKAVYTLLEREGVLANAVKKGYDSVIFADQSLSGKSGHDTWWIPDAKQVKSAASNSGDFSATNPNIHFSPSDEDTEARYSSKLKSTIDEKFSGESMPAAQLAAILRNPSSGIKADELKWSGIDDFLKGKHRVTKSEVKDYLGSQDLTPIEVTKVGKEPVIEGFSSEGDTAYMKYSLPGPKENYREILFQLPVSASRPDFESSHWDEKNVVAHARVDDRNNVEGKPGLFVEEVQSDWHQEGRKKGYYAPKS